MMNTTNGTVEPEKAFAFFPPKKKAPRERKTIRFSIPLQEFQDALNSKASAKGENSIDVYEEESQSQNVQLRAGHPVDVSFKRRIKKKLKGTTSSSKATNEGEGSSLGFEVGGNRFADVIKNIERLVNQDAEGYDMTDQFIDDSELKGESDQEDGLQNRYQGFFIHKGHIEKVKRKARSKNSGVNGANLGTKKRKLKKLGAKQSSKSTSSSAVSKKRKLLANGVSGEAANLKKKTIVKKKKTKKKTKKKKKKRKKSSAGSESQGQTKKTSTHASSKSTKLAHVELSDEAKERYGQEIEKTFSNLKSHIETRKASSGDVKRLTGEEQELMKMLGSKYYRLHGSIDSSLIARVSSFLPLTTPTLKKNLLAFQRVSVQDRFKIAVSKLKRKIKLMCKKQTEQQEDSNELLKFRWDPTSRDYFWNVTQLHGRLTEQLIRKQKANAKKATDGEKVKIASYNVERSRLYTELAQFWPEGVMSPAKLTKMRCYIQTRVKSPSPSATNNGKRKIPPSEQQSAAKKAATAIPVKPADSEAVTTDTAKPTDSGATPSQPPPDTSSEPSRPPSAKEDEDECIVIDLDDDEEGKDMGESTLEVTNEASSGESNLSNTVPCFPNNSTLSSSAASMTTETDSSKLHAPVPVHPGLHVASTTALAPANPPHDQAFHPNPVNNSINEAQLVTPKPTGGGKQAEELGNCSGEDREEPVHVLE